MKVYVEYVLIDNFVLDYLLLKLTFIAKKGVLKKHGLLVGALFGSFTAILLPLVNLPNILLLAIKIFSGIGILLCAARFKNILQLLKFFNVFCLLTFSFGGAIFAIFSLIGVDYSILYSSGEVFPIGVILVLAVIVYKLLFSFFCSLYQNKLIYPFVRRCEILHNGHKIVCNGFIDSGNQIVYGNFYSVCIASKSLARNLVFQGLIGENLVGEICINTVSGKTQLKIFEFEKLMIYSSSKVNIIKDVKIGILQNAIELSEDYDLILTHDFL